MNKVSKRYHLLFWVFVFLFVFDHLDLFFDRQQAILYSLLELFIYALISYTNLYLLIPRIYTSKRLFLYISSLVLLLAVIYLPYWYFDLDTVLMGGSAWKNLYSFTINYTFFVVISFFFWYVGQYRLEHQKRLELENEKLKAELQLVKSHVSPHFLFNSLNNIYSLIASNNENASVMVEKLADFLRYIIYEGKKERVPLQEEVTLIQSYFDLQQLKKLKAESNLVLQIKGVNHTHKIAPLILINLVENCFKHGDIAFNAEGFLSIDIRVEKNSLYFKTSNTFVNRNKEEGIGLLSTREQLKHSYPGKHTFRKESTGRVFEVNLKIEL